jgi:hypothetical protein
MSNTKCIRRCNLALEHCSLAYGTHKLNCCTQHNDATAAVSLHICAASAACKYSDMLHSTGVQLLLLLQYTVVTIVSVASV